MIPDPFQAVSLNQQLLKLDKQIEKLTEISDSLKADDWYEIITLDLTIARNDKGIQLPAGIVKLSTITVFKLDNPISLTLLLKSGPGKKIDYTTTMKISNLDVRRVYVTNTASSGEAKIYLQGNYK